MNLIWSLCSKKEKEKKSGWPSLWLIDCQKFTLWLCLSVHLVSCGGGGSGSGGGDGGVGEWTHCSLWDFRRLLLPWVERPQCNSAWLAHVATRQKKTNEKTTCHKKWTLFFSCRLKTSSIFWKVSHSMALKSLQLISLYKRSAWVIILLPASACVQ